MQLRQHRRRQLSRKHNGENLPSTNAREKIFAISTFTLPATNNIRHFVPVENSCNYLENYGKSKRGSPSDFQILQNKYFQIISMRSSGVPVIKSHSIGIP